jgi:hypothetical protein|tara:strand:+ start:205 stop:399 length:195 start_codon:yes stop_codon:yes gene_type:complete
MRDDYEIKQKVAEVEENLEVLLTYLHSRTKQRDWHGVEDAASDIRDNESALTVLRWVLEESSDE